MKEIPVFFTVDDRYAPCLSCALISAKEHASPENKYTVTIVHKDLDKKHIERLSRISGGNFTIDFYEMDKVFDTITDIDANRLNCSIFTLAIFFRLFIPESFPRFDKGIYLDSDVIVNDDLAKMYDVELGDDLLGGCVDLSVAEFDIITRYYEEAIGVKFDRYINSGVLLMNMKRLRELKLGENFLRLLNKYHFDSVCPDQDYINSMAKDKIRYLDRRWDAMPCGIPVGLEDPGIVHYNLFHKPWCADGVEYADLFWKYAEKSEYYDDLKEFKANYTPDKTRADNESWELLLRRAEKIPDGDVTFKKAYLAGERIRLC